MKVRALVATLAVVGLVLLAGAGVSLAPASSPDPDTRAISSETDPSAIITAESMYNRIYFLANDALQGRDTPSRGLEVAAAYLVSEHRRMGSAPGMGDSYYQRWPYRLMAPDVDAVALSLEGEGGSQAVEVGSNAAVRGGALGEISGDLLLVGSSEGAPAAGSMEGKVAVFALPLTDGWSNQVRALSLRQARFAAASGAVATIHLLGPEATPELVGELAEQLADPARFMGEEFPSPQLYLTRDAAEGAVPGLAQAVDGLSDDETREVDGRLHGQLPMEILDDAHPPNVVAVIPGSDPVLRDEYVVLSAHFDHVGIGQPMDGDSIYNGADDNASGTSALLEVARAINAMPEAPRRSVMFTHVSGEEKGLLGADWFVENPPVPIESMVANINADMIGSDTHQDTLVVIGKEYSSLGPLVDDINASMPELGLVTSDDLWPEQRFFYRSDQFHFMRKEIPSLFFFTGVHECYHRPCDTADFIDPDKAARIARLLTLSVLEIANADARPEWDAAGLAEVRELTGTGR